MSGTCKKTYQGHVNTKYSLGGAFGRGGTEGFIVSGSENGDILFWDVRTKDVVQIVNGHEGVVCWVDTCPGPSRTVASGGLDGTVRIWVDVSEMNEDGVSRMDFEDGAFDTDMDGVIKLEDDAGYGNDTLGRRISVNGNGHASRGPSPDAMEED